MNVAANQLIAQIALCLRLSVASPRSLPVPYSSGGILVLEKGAKGFLFPQ